MVSVATLRRGAGEGATCQQHCEHAEADGGAPTGEPMKPAWGPEWQLVVDHVIAQCPMLPRDQTADFVQAAGSTVSLRRFAAYVTDRPDALISGSSDAPPPLVHLTELLVGAGIGGIRRPCCLRCGLPRPLPTIVDGGRVCSTCHRREMIEVCCRCAAGLPNGHARGRRTVVSSVLPRPCEAGSLRALRSAAPGVSQARRWGWVV
jgi:hypothetical protein